MRRGGRGEGGGIKIYIYIRQSSIPRGICHVERLHVPLSPPRFLSLPLSLSPALLLSPSLPPTRTRERAGARTRARAHLARSLRVRSFLKGRGERGKKRNKSLHIGAVNLTPHKKNVRIFYRHDKKDAPPLPDFHPIPPSLLHSTLIAT